MRIALDCRLDLLPERLIEHLLVLVEHALAALGEELARSVPAAAVQGVIDGVRCQCRCEEHEPDGEDDAVSHWERRPSSTIRLGR